MENIFLDNNKKKQNEEAEIKLTYSGIVSKDDKPCVRVQFEGIGKRAEGFLPEGKISDNEGFSEEEVLQLEAYLKENKTQLLGAAKEISGWKHLLS